MNYITISYIHVHVFITTWNLPKNMLLKSTKEYAVKNPSSTMVDNSIYIFDIIFELFIKSKAHFCL